MWACPRRARPERLRSRIKVSQALLLAAVLAASVIACGGEDEQGSSSSNRDGGESPGVRDNSDSIETYGTEADAASEAAIAAAVTSFFAANAAGHDAEACRLLSSAARRQVSLTLGRSPELKGRGCRAILSRLFKLQRPQYRAGIKKIKVTGARVQGDRGFALLEAKAVPADAMPVQREDGAWKVAAVTSSQLP